MTAFCRLFALINYKGAASSQNAVMTYYLFKQIKIMSKNLQNFNGREP